MEDRVAPLAAIFELNTDLLLNCLEGVSDAEAQQCLAGGGNSIAFLAAHLTDTRHFLVKRLGNPLPNPLTRYLADAQGIADIREWPALSEIRAGWLAVSAHLQATLGKLTAGDLSQSDIHRFPVSDTTKVGMITFLAQHDSYHVGQMGFLRRQLGKPAMTYGRGAQSATAAGAT